MAEDHYYPHGLPIKGLSSALTSLEGFRDNRRKYQSNEYIQDLGLNWMSFGARQYDPQIGRFLSIDPLADGEGQQVFSPYAAMGNAPESMVDPNGMYFTFASGILEATFNNLMKENDRRRDAYNKELAKLDINSTDPEVQARIGILTLLIAAHNAFSEQIGAMSSNPNVEFHISNNVPFEGAAATAFYNFEEGRVQFNMGGDNPWIATLAHELRHGVVHLKDLVILCMISKTKKKGIKWDYYLHPIHKMRLMVFTIAKAGM